MFDKLHRAFSEITKSFSEKELNEKDIDNVLFDLEIALLDSDVASEVIESIKADLKKGLVGSTVEKSQIGKIVQDSLISNISSLFDNAGNVDLLARINEKNNVGQPFLILFVGINGTGKTTSLAKIAYMLKQSKHSVVVAAADTFRAGAIEQLKEHAKRLNVKVVAQNYNSDPAAVARDAVLYAKSHRTDCVLIDTAGRMQTSKNLMAQIAKIRKVVNPDMTIFVGDSLAGNDMINQAREFFEHVTFDCSILTKSDADARGGAALSIVKVTSTPIVYVGVGQEYKDLKPFSKKIFLDIVFGSMDGVEIKKMDLVKDVGVKAESDLKDTKQLHVAKYDEPSVTPEIEQSTFVASDSKDEHVPDTESLLTSKIEQTSVGLEKEEPSVSDDDPFDGISDDDIAIYSDMFDVPPPENDNDAISLATKIRVWVKKGRLAPSTGELQFDTISKNEQLSETETLSVLDTEESFSPSKKVERQSETETAPSPATELQPSLATEKLATPSKKVERQSATELQPSLATEKLATPSKKVERQSATETAPSPDTEESTLLPKEAKQSTKTETAPSPGSESELIPEIKQTSVELEKEESSVSDDDPFDGISDDDIAIYSDMFDVPPPENGNDAVALATKIRTWISEDRPTSDKLDEVKSEKDTSEKDTSEKDTSEKDTSEKDTSEKDTSEKDTSEKDTSEKDTSEKDTSEKDTSEKDTSEKDTSEKDTSEKDTSEKDTSEKDTIRKG